MKKCWSLGKPVEWAPWARVESERCFGIFSEERIKRGERYGIKTSRQKIHVSCGESQSKKNSPNILASYVKIEFNTGKKYYFLKLFLDSMRRFFSKFIRSDLVWHFVCALAREMRIGVRRIICKW